MRVFQNNFSGGEISPAMYSRLDLDKYSTACKSALNCVVLPHGGVTKRPGLHMIDEIPGDAYIISFIYRVNEAFALVFYDNPSGTTTYPGLMRVFTRRGVIMNGNAPYTVATKYTLAEIREAGTVQSADTLFITHPSHKPRKLVRYGNTNWVFEDIAFTPGISAPSAPSVSASGFDGDATKTIKYQVSAVNSAEEESYPSTAASVTIPKSWTSGATVTVSWTAVEGAARYHVYKNERGFYGWVGTIEATEALSFVDDNISPASDDGPKTPGLDFSAANTYPGAVGIYQQRMVFARSNNEPQSVWCSQPGALNNFSTSYPLKDTDSITAALDSRQMNEIRHMYLLKNVLVVFTAGAEYLMSPGRNSDAITPSSVNFEAQSFYGCSKVPPLQAGGAILMLQNSGKIVRDMYSTYTNEYEGNEVSIMAEHLFLKPIIDWAWQEEPYHTAYAVREDGVLLTFTYLREQKLSAWSHHTTGPNGAFRSVGCIAEENTNRVYCVVRRKLNGVTRYFVEYMDTREYGSPIEDSFFVDCGVSYDGRGSGGAPDVRAQRITGLDHLYGEKVVALADGGVVEDIEVVKETREEIGQPTVTEYVAYLPVPSLVVHIGLPYTMRVTTLDPEINAQNGPTSGMRKNAVRAHLRVRDARDFFIGAADGELALVKFPLAKELGGVPELYVGDVETVLYGSYRSEASVTVEHRDPLPATLLSLNLTVNSEH